MRDFWRESLTLHPENQSKFRGLVHNEFTLMKQILSNTAHLVIRKDVIIKDGSSSIMLRLKISGKKKDISLGEQCPIKFWDDEKQRIKRSYQGASGINNILEGKLARAHEII